MKPRNDTPTITRPARGEQAIAAARCRLHTLRVQALLRTTLFRELDPAGKLALLQYLDG